MTVASNLSCVVGIEADQPPGEAPNESPHGDGHTERTKQIPKWTEAKTNNFFSHPQGVNRTIRIDACMMIPFLDLLCVLRKTHRQHTPRTALACILIYLEAYILGHGSTSVSESYLSQDEPSMISSGQDAYSSKVTALVTA